MNVNFFWRGKNFQFLNRLTLVSHVEVGHKVIVWLQGVRPESKYWIDDIPEIEIRDAKEIYNVGELKKGNVRAFSTIWSYHFLWKKGEYIADCDAIALKHWPDDKIVLCSANRKDISVGVIRLPKEHIIVKKAKNNYSKTWGNVKIFSKIVRNNGLNVTHPSEDFYPVHAGEKEQLFEDISIPDSYSWHYFSNKLSEKNCTHKWIYKPELQNSLFRKLVIKNFIKYGYTNGK